MAEVDDLFKGIRRAELRVFFRLFPVFRRYLKDRESAKKDEEGVWSYDREKHGEKALNAFISLGPTFIKLGQVLSARPDLLPGNIFHRFRNFRMRCLLHHLMKFSPHFRKT